MPGRRAVWPLRVHHRLEHFETEQPATLARRGERHLDQTQHVLSLKVPQFRQRLAFDMLAQDRRCRLADRTSLAIEECCLNAPRFIELQFQADLITTKRILFGVRTGCTLQMSFVVWAFVMVQNVVVVKLFVHGNFLDN